MTSGLLSPLTNRKVRFACQSASKLFPIGRDKRTMSSFESIPVTSPLAGRTLVPVKEPQPLDQYSTLEAYRGKSVQQSIKEKTKASRQSTHFNTVTRTKKKAAVLSFLLPEVKGNIIINQQYIRVLDKKPVRKITSARPIMRARAKERVEESPDLCPLL